MAEAPPEGTPVQKASRHTVELQSAATMTRTFPRSRQRPARIVKLELPFDDIMEFALGLLSLTPTELEELGWTFDDRKQLLDYFLASARVAQGKSSTELAHMRLPFSLPARHADRLRLFVIRELPKTATNAAMLNRVDRALAEALLPSERTLSSVSGQGDAIPK